MTELTVSKAEFADIYGCRRSYVSQLVAEGRLELTEDGKRVRVEASLEKLGVTADPAKSAVRERWAAYRGRTTGAAAPADVDLVDQVHLAKPAAPAPMEPPPAVQATEAPRGQVEAPAQGELDLPATHRKEDRDVQVRRAAIRLEIEEIDRQRKHLGLMKDLSRVAEIDPMLRAVVDGHMAARNELMAMPDRLTAIVAPVTDPAQVYALIEAECEQIVARMHAHMQRLKNNHQATAAA